jgi:hypothetical protein
MTALKDKCTYSGNQNDQNDHQILQLFEWLEKGKEKQ